MVRRGAYPPPMPSPLEHLDIASDVAATVGIHGNVGAFLAGAVCPDVDKAARWPRSTTHWWGPRGDVSGALRLVAARPDLRHVAPGSDIEAFVAGYLCHLVVDEQWTLRIYRRYFGRNTPFAASRDGSEHQWALQSWMDTDLVASGRINQGVSELAATGSIERWSSVVVGPMHGLADTFVASVVARASLPRPVDRYRAMAEVTARANGSAGIPNAQPRLDDSRIERPTDDPGSLDAFLMRLPELEVASTALVPSSDIEMFRATARTASVRLIKQFMAGEALEPPPGTAVPPYLGSPPLTDL